MYSSNSRRFTSFFVPTNKTKGQLGALSVLLSHGRFPLYFTTDISLPFFKYQRRKMSPLSKKRGHHDLRILGFDRIASTAAVRTRGDFGSIPSPLHLAHSLIFRRQPIMNHSVVGACFLHELQIKTVQHSTDGYAEQHP